MNWNSLQRWKIFHFWCKNFHFGNFFQHLDLLVCQIASQMEEVHIFPISWKIFHFEKIQKNIFLFQNHMNRIILQRWKFFHFGEFFFSASGSSRLPNPIPKEKKNFRFGGEFSTSKKLKKKENKFKIT